jgi:DNA-binding protein H-NS
LGKPRLRQFGVELEFGLPNLEEVAPMASTLADINSQIKKHDEQIAQLRKQAEELRNQERAGVIEELRKKIAEYGLTAADLKLTSTRGGKKTSSVAAAVKSAAKYRSPTGETWSGGRGRKPRWITEALAAGKSLSDFEIR